MKSDKSFINAFQPSTIQNLYICLIPHKLKVSTLFGIQLYGSK
jgi:hypothetical protein